MNPLGALGLSAALAAGVMTLGWWWQKRHDNAGIVSMGVHFLSGANLIFPAEWRRVRPGD